MSIYLWCLKYKFELSEVIAEEKSNCYYFIEPQVEDGEPLTAAQVLMLKECELASRRMRGPVLNHIKATQFYPVKPGFLLVK